MKRSTFFLIAAIVATAFGALMLLVPRFAAQGFNLAASGETDTLFRALGATLLSLAVLNFLVRNHPASETLKAVLWTNVAGARDWVGRRSLVGVPGAAVVRQHPPRPRRPCRHRRRRALLRDAHGSRLSSYSCRSASIGSRRAARRAGK